MDREKPKKGFESEIAALQRSIRDNDSAAYRRRQQRIAELLPILEQSKVREQNRKYYPLGERLPYTRGELAEYFLDTHCPALTVDVFKKYVSEHDGFTCFDIGLWIWKVNQFFYAVQERTSKERNYKFKAKDRLTKKKAKWLLECIGVRDIDELLKEISAELPRYPEHSYSGLSSGSKPRDNR